MTAVDVLSPPCARRTRGCARPSPDTHAATACGRMGPWLRVPSARSIWTRSRPTSRCCARTRPRLRCWPSSRPTRTGTGCCPSARAALAGGADWLGTALLSEAAELRQQGITVPILRLAVVAGRRRPGRLRARRDRRHGQLPVAAGGADRGARTPPGCGRASSSRSTPGWVATAPPPATGRHSWSGPPRWRPTGRMQVTGVWSHFAVADAPSSATNAEQLVAFDAALEVVAAAGLTPGCATSPTPRRPWHPRRRTTTWSGPGSPSTGCPPAASWADPSSTGSPRR